LFDFGQRLFSGCPQRGRLFAVQDDLESRRHRMTGDQNWRGKVHTGGLAHGSNEAKDFEFGIQELRREYAWPFPTSFWGEVFHLLPEFLSSKFLRKQSGGLSAAARIRRRIPGCYESSSVP
jgi:hypothetical protein